ncbi:hypothetical protein [Streptomyces sp. NPDC047453]|uniref:hypothetical protein n=1 Tax=Streptomyces sp. NPDC047453 TaxID=3154812 RepID=UPI0033CAF974
MTEARFAAVFDAARDQALEELTGLAGRVRACTALGVSRATYYRHHRQSPAPARPRRERRRHPRALAPEEEIRVLDVLHSPEFADMAPTEIYAVLLDRGVYLCSESTSEERTRAAVDKAYADQSADAQPQIDEAA